MVFRWSEPDKDVDYSRYDEARYIGRMLRNQHERIQRSGAAVAYLARGTDMRQLDLRGISDFPVHDVDAPRSYLVRMALWGDLDAPPPPSYSPATRPAVLEDFL